MPDEDRRGATASTRPGSEQWRKLMLSRGLFPLGGQGVLGRGWPQFEQDERELGVKPAMALDEEDLDPMCWVLDLLIHADALGITPEQVLGC